MSDSAIYSAAVEIREALPSEAERRRYALLQAAAAIYAERSSAPDAPRGAGYALYVHVAVGLLDAIEQWERGE